MTTAGGDAANAERARAAGRPRARAQSRSGAILSSPPAWGVVGFLVGAVFWHLVGFWSLVSKVAFKGSDPVVSAIEQSAGKPDRALDGGERARQIVAASRCIDLRLDRSTRRVYALACEGSSALIKAGPPAGRGDIGIPARMLVPAVAGWSTQVHDGAVAEREPAE